MFDNPISDLLGQALSGCENGSSSVDGLKIVLANVNDLSIARAMVEQYVDQLGNGASDCTFGKMFLIIVLKSKSRFQYL